MADMALKHIIILALIITFMFFGVLGTCCADGACGGDPETFELVGYLGWGFGLFSTCVGIGLSQEGTGGKKKKKKTKEEDEE